MSWQNAPALNKLTASQQGGKLGARVWGVDYKGRLYTNSQKTAGGPWSEWQGASWSEKNYPQEIYELAASQQADGGTQLWVLDKNRNLWTIKQDRPGSDWGNWQKDWNKPPGSFHFKKMAALWTGPNHGARFWGITESGILTSCAQAVPAGNWGAWSDWPKTPYDPNKNPPERPAEWIEVTACDQGNGKGALWALDTKLQLWAMFQESPGGAWGKWQGPNWKNAPKLRNIAAVDMSAPSSPGSRDIVLGACIFGITENYKLVYNNQSRPGYDDWWGWSPASFKDSLMGYEITAAVQNNHSARVWFISNELGLVSQQVNINSSPPGWERYWTPEEP